MWDSGLNLFDYQQKYCIWCLVVCLTLWHKQKTLQATAILPDQCQSKTKHKGNYIGCLLCPWSVLLFKVYLLIKC